MKTRQKIQEGLDGFKRTENVGGMINRCTNHLFDAFRELEMAIEHCDDKEFRDELEDIKEKLGKDNEVAGYIDNEKSTVIGDLQETLKKYNIK